MFSFDISHESKKSHARLGKLNTPHGIIKTPAFVPCATKGTVKSLAPVDLLDVKTQLVFVNTYHMVLSPGLDVLKKGGGIHGLSKITVPIITDSGGFQVFSLAKRHSSFTMSSRAKSRDLIHKQEPTLVKITDDGVKFKSHIDGTEYFFTPEFSIDAQKIIGGDFIVAFDECVPADATYNYTKKSLVRTHNWAKRSLACFVADNNLLRTELANDIGAQTSSPRANHASSNMPYDVEGKRTQKMYGVIQGGRYEDLRKNSAEFIASLPFFGIALGGVSVGETNKELRNEVGWMGDVLHGDNRPRHLLGVGSLADIIYSIEQGVDTVDCASQTRLARMGQTYISHNYLLQKFETLEMSDYLLDISKSKNKYDLSPLDAGCLCSTCTTFTRAYLHHLFKQRELSVYRYLTIHNLYFMEKFFKVIRSSIQRDTL